MDELPLELVGWMTDQLAEYEVDPKEWVKDGAIGWDDLDADPDAHEKWRVRGAEHLPFEED